MTAQLISLGLDGTQLVVAADGATFEGETLKTVTNLLTELAEPLLTLERRGVDMRFLASRHLTADGLLPRYRVFQGREQHWFADKEQLDAFLAETQAKHGDELRISAERADTDTVTAAVDKGEAEASVPEDMVQVVDLHENRAINKILQQLAGYGFKLKDLLPAGYQNGAPVYPFSLKSDGDEVKLASLRELVGALRKLGERGLTLTRFKGLGEMDSEELWATAMDPAARTLLQVQMEDASAADEIFRVLMGDHVEPRREFIEKHALEVKDLDV